MDRTTTAGDSRVNRALAGALLAVGFAALTGCTDDSSTTATRPTARPAKPVAKHHASATPAVAHSVEVQPAAVHSVASHPVAAVSPAPIRSVATRAPAPPVAIVTGTSIRSAVASPTVVHAGQTETWTVRTSDDVTGVDADVSIYHFTLKRMSAGRFEFSFSIPPEVPPFFHGRYAVGLTAHGTSDASASMAIDFE